MGVTAQQLVDLGPLAPLRPPIYIGGELFAFDASIGCLLLAAIVISSSWDENYAVDPAAAPASDSPNSAKSVDASLSANFIGGVAARMRYFRGRGREPLWQHMTSVRSEHRLGASLRTLTGDPVLLALMCITSATEAAMYAFVLEWTPALTTLDSHPPYGVIFSAFMVAYMGGSVVFSLSLHWGIAATTMLLAYLATACCALTATWAVFASGANLAPGGTFCVFLLLTLFEFTLGGYMATVATIKAQVVPESIRSTIYNFFRVPLNVIVVVLNLVSVSTEFTFLGCSLLLFLATLGAAFVHGRVGARGKTWGTASAPLL